MLGDDRDLAREHASELAARLQMFGERAKQVLLRRAGTPFTPNNYERVEAADYVLAKWQDWSESDIPALTKIIRQNYDSQLGWALAKIGTPAAIRALIGTDDTIGDFGSPNPATTEAIKSLGDSALPYLFEALNAKIWIFTQQIIQEMPENAARAAPSWLALATDVQQPTSVRVAALRALGGLGKSGVAMHDSIAALRGDANPDVRCETFHALREMGEAGSASELVEFCLAMANAFTTSRWDANRPAYELNKLLWENCLKEIAWLGDDALPYGEQIAGKFLGSPNGTDRADGASALGYIGYKPAIPRLIVLLDDPDWRVVYASARALRWLQADAAMPACNASPQHIGFPTSGCLQSAP